MSIRIDVIDGGGKEIQRLLERLKNPGDFWNRVGIKMQRSVQKNFRAGGRPVKWLVSDRARREGGQTLIDKGSLRASINWKRLSSRTGVSIGTPLKYGKMHNRGFQGTVAVPAHTRRIKQAFGRPLKSPVSVDVRAHSRRLSIEKRKFILVQKRDWKDIANLLHKFLEARK